MFPVITGLALIIAFSFKYIYYIAVTFNTIFNNKYSDIYIYIDFL